MKQPKTTRPVKKLADLNDKQTLEDKWDRYGGYIMMSLAVVYTVVTLWWISQ